MSKINVSHVTTSDALNERQVKNNSGGFVFKVDPMDQLRRFMVLGVTGGTYYQNEKALTYQNAKEIVALIAKDGKAVVREIVEFAVNNRAPKKDPQLFALALCAVTGDREVRKCAYDAMSEVCNIPTHLFTFIDYCEGLSKQLNGSTGWGRARREAVANWYNELSTRDLVYRTTKYKQRNGWSNRDLLRLAHVKPKDNEHGLIYKFIAKDELVYDPATVSDKESFDRLVACDEVQRADKVEQVVKLIHDFNLVREHIPTQWLKNPKVWEALLPKMPLNALVRNVGRLTSLGLLSGNSEHTKMVLKKIASEKAVSRARLHPFNVLVGYNMYKNGGKGGKGSLRWTPNSLITKGLNELFYNSFDHVEPSNKRFYLGIDVSGSMSWEIPGATGMTCAMGAAAMAMTIARTEPMSHIKAFNNGVQDLKVKRNESLESVHKKVDGINWGGTDCSLPMYDALQRGLQVDTFVVITDNETNPGMRHPVKMLNEYREKTGIDAKLAVIGMTSTGFSIADPNDRGMMDFVGWDSACPRILRDFSAGTF